MNISQMIKKAIEELTTMDILNQYKNEIMKLIQKIKEIHRLNLSDKVASLPILYGKFGKYVLSYCERGFVKDEIVANDISLMIDFNKYDIKKILIEIIQYLDNIIKRN
jgi:hypothetical protein